MDPGSTPELPSDGYLGYLQTRIFASLDGLRAVAILAVVWHHAGEGNSDIVLTGRGFLGVDLFFVISGFLIVTLLLRERRRRGTISLRGFYWRRVLRIFPAYYLLLAIVGALALVTSGPASKATLHDLPYAFFYLSNLVPMEGILSITWSLAAEEQFYIVVPTLEKIVPRAMRFAMPAAYVVAMLPTFGLLPWLELPPFFRETTFAPIILGVMLAHVLDSPRGFGMVSCLLGGRRTPVLVLAIALIAASHPAEDISGWPRLLIHWSFAALVASCVIREDHWLRPILGFRPLKRIGTVSYGIYLYHLLIAHVVVALLARLQIASRSVVFVLAAGVTWLAAEVSFRWFESRFLAFKNRNAAPRGA